MQELTDGQLLRQFTAGNASAFGELVARHMPMVYRAAARQVGQDLAEDVAQGVFLVLAQKARHVHGEMLAGWLVRATWLASLAARRAERRRRFHEERAMLERPLNPPPNGPDGAAWSELRAAFDAALARMRPADRTALVLRVLEGRTTREVAFQMRLTEAAAAKRIQRGLAKLRSALGEKVGDPTMLSVAIMDMERSAKSMPAELPGRVAAEFTRGMQGMPATLIAQATARAIALAQWKTAATLIGGGLATGIAGGMLLAASRSPPPHPLALAQQQPADSARKALEDLFARRTQAAGAMTGDVEMEQLGTDAADLPALQALDARGTLPQGRPGSRMVTTADDVAQRHLYIKWWRAAGALRQERAEIWHIKAGTAARPVGQPSRTCAVDAFLSADLALTGDGLSGAIGTPEQATWDWTFQTPFKMGLGCGRIDYAQLIRESPIFEIRTLQEANEGQESRPMQVVTVAYPGTHGRETYDLHVDPEGRVVQMRFDFPLEDGGPDIREETTYSAFESHRAADVDVWLPREMVCEHEKWSAVDKRFLVWMTEKVHIKAVAINQILPPETFRLTFPPAARVFDEGNVKTGGGRWIDGTAANLRMQELRTANK
jgi:RNA polymerase sigma factor (sigma-70 family)